MALEDLTTRIKEDAAAERERLLKEAEKKAEGIRKDAQQAFAEAKDAKTAAMKQEEERLRRSVRVTTSMKVRSYELAQRRELMTLVRERALNQLVQMDDSAYEAFLAKHLGNIDAREGEVTPAKGRKAVTEAAVRTSGKGFAIGNEDQELAGGFHFQSGNMRIDASFESLLAQFFADEETRVADQLFGTPEKATA